MFDVGKAGHFALATLFLVGFSQSLLAAVDWEDAYERSNFSKTSKLSGVTAIRDYLHYEIPVGFLNEQDAIVQWNSDTAGPYRKVMYSSEYRDQVTLPESTNKNAVSLDALGDFFYIQAIDPDTNQSSLQRCTLTGCLILKNQAADPTAIQMGLPSHTLNPQGVLLTWYQDQAQSPRTNRLSFFDVAGIEREVLVGDGYVSGISRPNASNQAVNGIGLLDTKPILVQLENNQTKWWYLPQLGLSELVPVAIDGNENPKVVLLEKNKLYDGSIYTCDIDWSLNEDGSLKCVDGLKNLGVKAEFNLGWHLTDDGYLYANGVTFEGYNNGPEGALINTLTSQVVRLRSIASSGKSGKSFYYYTSIHGDIVFRSLEGYSRYSLFYMLEADKNQDSLGDGWTRLFPSTLNNPKGDEDEDGLDNREEYRFGSDPTRADADQDGLNDKQEYVNKGDPFDRDTDNDGLRDADELALGTKLNNDDTDGDGHKDGYDDFPLDETQFEDYESDEDNDGIPDYFEDNTTGIYAHIHDSGNDQDNDGLTNLQEFHLGTDLSNNDSDSDGLPDAYEVASEFNPLDASEAGLNADADLDGWNNILEYQASTNPNDVNEFPDKGMLKWSVDEIDQEGWSMNAIGPDKTIYIPAKYYIYSVSPSGGVNWKVNTQDNFVTPVIAPDGTLYIADKNELKVLNPDGSLKWSKSGRWYVSIGEFGRIYATGGNSQFVSFDENGSEIWSHYHNVNQRPIVAIDNVYVLSNDNIYAYDKEGNLLWDFEADHSVFSTAIDMNDQSVIFWDYSRQLFRLSPDGKLLLKVKLDTHPAGTPMQLDAKGNIYYFGKSSTGYNQGLQVYNKYGVKQWEKYLPIASRTPIVIGKSGTVYVGSDKRLYAYDASGNELWVVDGVEGTPVLSIDNHIYMGRDVIQIPGSDYDGVYWSHVGKGATNSGSVCDLSDRDCDGLPESYELENGFDTSLNEANEDADSDGLTNYQEFISGTSPNFSDSDGDTIPDRYEVEHGLNATVADATDDLDGDGFDNITEYNEGTNVNNINATPLNKTGQLRWQLNLNFENVVMDDNGTMYGYLNNELTAVDKKGSILWIKNISAEIQSLSMLDKDRLMAVTSTGIKFVLVSDGSETYEISGNYSNVARTENGLLAVSNKTIFSYTLEGIQIWNIEIPHSIANISVNSVGFAYIGSSYQYFSVVSPEGELLWTHSLIGHDLSPLAIDSLGNVVFNASSTIYSYDINGNRRWFYSGSNDYSRNFSPVIGADDTTYMTGSSSSSSAVFILGIDKYGNYTTSITLPNTPGQLAIDSSNRVYVPMLNSVGIYQADTEFRVIGVDEEAMSSKPELMIDKSRLILSYETGLTGRLVDLYAEGAQESLSWSVKGGGNHNGNSVCALVDADCDGMPDDYEISIGLDPDIKDTHLDKDDDGIINITELQLGLNILNPDSDGDGMDDHFELLNGLDYLLDDSDLDLDLDGSSNLDEYLAGSDINDPTATSVKENGNKLWQRPVATPQFVVDGNLSTYVIEDPKLGSDKLVSYDQYGGERWRALLPEGEFVSMMMPNGNILVAYSEEQLNYYSADSGELKWSIENIGEFAAVGSDAKGQLYIVCNSHLFSYDINGVERWRQSIAQNSQSPVIDSIGNVYVRASSYSSTRIESYNENGVRKWQFEIGDQISQLALDSHENLLFTSKNQLYKIDKNGKELWHSNTSSSSSAREFGPVLGFYDVAYVVNGYNNISAFDPKGNEIWSKNLEDKVYGSLSVSQGGRIYYPSDKKIVSLDRIGNVTETLTSSDSSISNLSLVNGYFFTASYSDLSKRFSDNNGLAYAWSATGGSNNLARNRCGFNDADCDGLPDDYELQEGLDPQLHDTWLDPDQDGLDSISELQLGTDPHKNDTDLDGIDDGYEVEFKFNSLVDDAHEDADQDGYTNLDEYLIASDPNDAESTALKKLGNQQWKVKGANFTDLALNSNQYSYVAGNGGVSRINKYGVVEWSKLDGNYYLPSLVDEDNLLLYDTSGDDSELVNALSGDVKWELKGSFSRPVFSSDNSIYTISSGKSLRRYSLLGELQWSISGSFTHLSIINNHIISSYGKDLSSRSSQGDLQWSQFLLDSIRGVYSDLQGNIIVGLRDGLAKLNGEGKLLWQIELDGNADSILTGFGESFYVLRDSYDSYIEKYSSGGELIWSKKIVTAITGTLALGKDNKVYIPHSNALSIVSDGGAINFVDLPGMENINSIALMDESLLVASENGYFRLFNNGKEQGLGWSSYYGGVHNRGAIVNAGDSDGDGLPDDFEISVGLNPNTQDLHDDADGDGLSNIIEISKSMNPFSVDSDEDGMSDSYEVNLGFDPVLNDSALDFDDDGYTNLQEFEEGGNPKDGGSTASMELGTLRWSAEFTNAQFAIDDHQNIYAWSNNELNAMNKYGVNLWELSVSKLQGAPVIISDDKIVLTTGDNLVLVNAITGNIIWSVNGDFEQVIQGENKNLYALDSDGDLFSYSLAGEFIFSDSDSDSYESIVRLNNNGIVARKGRYLYILNEEGDRLESIRGDDDFSALSLSMNGEIIVSDDENSLVKYNQAGDLLWMNLESDSVGGSRRHNSFTEKFSPLVGISGESYTLFGNDLVAIASSGVELWRATLSFDAIESPVLSADSRVIVPVSNGLSVISNSGQESFIAVSGIGSVEQILVSKDKLLIADDKYLRSIYIGGEGEAIGWSSINGGSYNGSTVCALNDLDCNGISDSFEQAEDEPFEKKDSNEGICCEDDQNANGLPD